MWPGDWGYAFTAATRLSHGVSTATTGGEPGSWVLRLFLPLCPLLGRAVLQGRYPASSVAAILAGAVGSAEVSWQSGFRGVSLPFCLLYTGQHAHLQAYHSASLSGIPSLSWGTSVVLRMPH